MDELAVGRVARSAGITREQARKALAAAPEPPSGGPHYVRRMGYLREVCEAMGESVWRLSDATLEKRLNKMPRVARLIRYAKEADRQAAPPPPSE